MLYELLTGARPFPGDSITTLVYQILHTEPRDPLELKADLPVATREVVARLLAKSPDRRPANAQEFVRELKRIEKFQRESEMTRRAVSATPVASTVVTRAAVGRGRDGAGGVGGDGFRAAPPAAPQRHAGRSSPCSPCSSPCRSCSCATGRGG